MAKGLAATTARYAERGLVATRTRVSTLLDHLQLRLRAVELSRDPEVHRWASEWRERVARGEVDPLLDRQPADPRELIDRRSTPAA